MDFLDIFCAQNDRLVIGYLMDTKKIKFQPNLCLWQLSKEGNRQGILADFAKTCQNFKTLYLGLGMAKLRTLKG